MMKQMLTMLALTGSLAYAGSSPTGTLTGAGAPRQLSDEWCYFLRHEEFYAIIENEMGGAVEEDLNCWAQLVNGTNYWFEIKTGEDEYAYMKIYKPIGGQGQC